MITDYFSRRRFIQAGSVASAGLAFGLPALTKASAPGDTIGVGIIGTGSQGTYLAKLSQSVPQLKVLACCDIIPEQLSEGLKRSR